MISITIETSEVFNALTAAEQINVLRPPMVRSLARLQGTMATYPAPPAGSTYTRTGDYGRHWTQDVATDGDGITGKLGNAVRDRRYGRAYGPYVGDSEMQASVHRGRWETDQGALESNLDAILDDFAQAMNGAMESAI